jgi:Tfp pilus assembly protein PilV
MKIIKMRSYFISPRRNRAAFTLIDVMASVLVIGIALVAVITANGRAMSMMRSSKQAAVASKCLQQRIEQIRTYNWTQLTDAQAMQDLYATPPLPSVELPGFSEQVIVSAFTPEPKVNGAAPAPVAPFLQVSRGTNGTVTLVSDSTDLVSGPEVRVDVQITWPGPGGSTRMRQTSVIVSNGGVGR